MTEKGGKKGDEIKGKQQKGYGKLRGEDLEGNGGENRGNGAKF